jgi:hypothetical protein
MRPSITSENTGAVRLLGGTVKRTAILLAFALGGAWAVYTYAQEAYLAHRLGQQVSDLQRQDALLAGQNRGYHRDLSAMTSGAANEEEARLSGYSRPQEKLYMVTPSPSPTPGSATPSASAPPSTP